MAEQIQGPTMLCATQAVKAPPLKIGKISDDLVLPRAIPLVTAATVVGFGLLGAVVGTVVAGLQGLIMGTVLFGFIGYILANYSPLQGESFVKWFTLAASARRKQLEIDGEPVVIYVGIAPIRTPAAGTVRMLPGAVDVSSSHYDERGVLRKEALSDVPAFIPPEPIRESDALVRKRQEKANRPVKVKTAKQRKMPT